MAYPIAVVVLFTTESMRKGLFDRALTFFTSSSTCPAHRQYNTTVSKWLVPIDFKTGSEALSKPFTGKAFARFSASHPLQLINPFRSRAAMEKSPQPRRLLQGHPTGLLRSPPRRGGYSRTRRRALQSRLSLRATQSCASASASLALQHRPQSRNGVGTIPPRLAVILKQRLKVGGGAILGAR